MRATLLSLFALAACAPMETRVGPAQGVQGITSVMSAAFTGYRGVFACGDAFTATSEGPPFTVATRLTEDGCDFTFDQTVELLTAHDYAVINEFKDEVHFVRRIEFDLTRLSFFDDQGERFPLTRLEELQVTVNAQDVLSLEGFGLLPRMVVFSGAALEGMESDIATRTPCTAHVVTHLVLLDTDARSTGVRCEYDAQPTFVVSDLPN
jgi:hypothetical protein